MSYELELTGAGRHCDLCSEREDGLFICDKCQDEKDSELSQLRERVKELEARANELEDMAEGLASGRLKRWDRATIVEAVGLLAKGFRRALATTPRGGGT